MDEQAIIKVYLVEIITNFDVGRNSGTRNLIEESERVLGVSRRLEDTLPAKLG